METVNPSKPLAVITGASSGIGYEMAKQFAQHGYDLIIVSENPAIVEAAQTCRILGAEVESHLIDLSESNSVEELKNKIDETNRAVDAVCINAEKNSENGSLRLTQEISWSEEVSVINLNVISTIDLVKHMIKDMLKRNKRGKILLTTSVSGVMPEQLLAVYNASKSFIRTYTEYLRDQKKVPV